MKLKLADGDAYISGRSPQKARELIAAAEEAGLDTSLIRTTSGGYIVPKELGGEGGDATKLEIGHGLNTERYRDGIDDEQVEATVGGELLQAIQPVDDAGKVEGAILNQSEPTGAQTEGEATGNGSQTTGDSAVLHGSEDEAGQIEAHPGNETAEPEREDVKQASGVNERFNPADHNVAEVLAYLDTVDGTERQRVLDAENKSDKPRKGIVGTEEGK